MNEFEVAECQEIRGRFEVKKANNFRPPRGPTAKTPTLTSSNGLDVDFITFYRSQ